MAVPDLDEIRRPALELLAKENRLVKIREVFELLAPHFNLTEEEKQEMLPSGSQRKWHNRVNWSCYDLFRAGALDRPTKGNYQINAFGQELLSEEPGPLTRTILSKASAQFREFVSPNSRESKAQKTEDISHEDSTPDERIDNAVASISESLRSMIQL